MTDIHESLKPLAVSIDSLTPDPSNARKHDKRNIEAIKASLARFGQTKPIVLHANGSTIIAGNGTWHAAKELGWTHIAAAKTNLDTAEAVAYGIADNKTAELAEWEDDTLRDLMDALPDDLKLATGFEGDEIAEMLRLPSDEVHEDEVPPTPKEPITQAGDLWLLGDHVLLCADCTDPQAYENHKSRIQSDITFTSPPYALGNSMKLSGNVSMSKKGNAYELHDDSIEEWQSLMGMFFANCQQITDAQFINVQMLANNKRILVDWLHSYSDCLVDVAIWNKGHGAPAMAKGVLTSAFEFVFIFGDKDASRVVPFSSWHGNQKNVVDLPPQRKNDFADVHGATMPVELAAHFVDVLPDQCESVFDPFAGTGTTLIACEQTNRRFSGMEIDPKYCDVIVQRWENLTGKKAERVPAEVGDASTVGS